MSVGPMAERVLSEIGRENRVMAKCVREAVERVMSFDGPLGQCLDAGAHWGAVTVAMLEAGADRVVAVEADPSNFDGLLATLSEMGLRDRVDAVNLAIDRMPGMVANVRQAVGGNSGQRGIAFGEDNPIIATIPTITMDELVATYGPFDYCKMDIEGMEWELFGDPAPWRGVRWLDLDIHEDAVPCFSHRNEWREAGLAEIVREAGFGGFRNGEWRGKNRLFGVGVSA